jgi:hypothetical protein
VNPEKSVDLSQESDPKQDICSLSGTYGCIHDGGEVTDCDSDVSMMLRGISMAPFATRKHLCLALWSIREMRLLWRTAPWHIMDSEHPESMITVWGWPWIVALTLATEIGERNAHSE